MAKKEKLLSDILAETFETYLFLENRPIDTLVDFDKIKDVLPIPSVNGVDGLEEHLTDANKEELVTRVDEAYRTKDYGKLMEFLSFSYPISYSNKGKTITDMYNSIRKQLKKKESYELTYSDLKKAFETGKPLEKFIYDASTLSNQFIKKGKQVLDKEDKIRFLIQGYKVAKFFESHQEEMEHFRKMQEFFYENIKENGKVNSKISEEKLNELAENGFNVKLFRRQFHKSASIDPQNGRLMTSDIDKSSSALDSIEMRNVVESDKVIRSIFIGKYVQDFIDSKGKHIGFEDLDQQDKQIYPYFFSKEGKKSEAVIFKEIKSYADYINKIVNKIFSNNEEIVSYKPYSRLNDNGQLEPEEYTEQEKREHKKAVRRAIIESAIEYGAFASDTEEEFLNRLALACTDKIVTQHFNHASLSGVQIDDKGEFIDFVSEFPDSKNEPFVSQNRKCATATIYYDGKMYFVKNIPATVVGDSTNIADDKWTVSITDQELNALIVNLTNIYGISFCNLTANNIIVGKNAAALACVRAGKKNAKVSIETAFDVMKKFNLQRDVDNPYIHSEDIVRDFTTFDNKPYGEMVNGREREKYSQTQTIADLLSLFVQSVPHLTNSFGIYDERKQKLDSVRAYNDTKREQTLISDAQREQEEFNEKDRVELNGKSPSFYLDKLEPHEINNREIKVKHILDKADEREVEEIDDAKSIVTEKDIEVIPTPIEDKKVEIDESNIIESQKANVVQQEKTVEEVTIKRTTTTTPNMIKPKKPIVKLPSQVSVCRTNIIKTENNKVCYESLDGQIKDVKSDKPLKPKDQVKYKKLIAERENRDPMVLELDDERYIVKNGEICNSKTLNPLSPAKQVAVWIAVSKAVNKAVYNEPVVADKKEILIESLKKVEQKDSSPDTTLLNKKQTVTKKVVRENTSANDKKELSLKTSYTPDDDKEEIFVDFDVD